MKLESKIYKYFKNKNIFEVNKIVFVCNWINLTTKLWINDKQKIKNLGFDVTKIPNNLTRHFFFQSVLKNFFFNSPLLILYSKKPMFKNIISKIFSQSTNLLFIIINKRFYTLFQLKNCKQLCYKTIVNIFSKFMMSFVIKIFLKFFKLFSKQCDLNT